MSRTIITIAGAATGMTLASMLIVGSFAGALHQPAPHRLPVAVVGRAGVTGRLSAALSQQVPGAFDLKPHGTGHAAGEAIPNRDVDAARVPGPAQQRLRAHNHAGPPLRKTEPGVEHLHRQAPPRRARNL
jgi:hypothetical protein